MAEQDSQGTYVGVLVVRSAVGGITEHGKDGVRGLIGAVVSLKAFGFFNAEYIGKDRKNSSGSVFVETEVSLKELTLILNSTGYHSIRIGQFITRELK